MCEATEFSFVCPVCGHDEIVEVKASRTFITFEPYIEKDDDGFSVEMKEEYTELDEEIIRYGCAACGESLLTESGDLVGDTAELYQWLKDHNMLGEVLDQ